MNIKELILRKIKENKSITASEIVIATKFSRAYINKILQSLRQEGKIILLGKANKARWIVAEKAIFEKEKSKILFFRKSFQNKNLSEDLVLKEIKQNTGIFINLSDNISRILEYAFSEILNNAIEHSFSKKIDVLIKRTSDDINFVITDFGIGIFNNLLKNRNLKSELEAIQDLLKGKQTTMPKAHSGEGIFFTSKMADLFVIQSGKKRLSFHNILDDIFINDIKEKKGTKVNFNISIKSKTSINKIFRQYTDDTFEFYKTKAIVKLYKLDTNYISRSQARRITIGLEKFKEIILDFDKVESIGQAFADEIFRVWQAKCPNTKIVFERANDNINFMIKRALS